MLFRVLVGLNIG